MAELAAQFNRKETRNKYEIEALAVYGGYMSREPELAGLSIAVTGRRRTPAARLLWGGRRRRPRDTKRSARCSSS